MKGWRITLEVTGEDPLAGDVIATVYDLVEQEHGGEVLSSFVEPQPVDELAARARRRQTVRPGGAAA